MAARGGGGVGCHFRPLVGGLEFEGCLRQLTIRHLDCTNGTARLTASCGVCLLTFKRGSVPPTNSPQDSGQSKFKCY